MTKEQLEQQNLELQLELEDLKAKLADKPKAEETIDEIEVSFLQRDKENMPTGYVTKLVPRETAEGQLILSREDRNPSWKDACYPEDRNVNLIK